MKGYITKFIPSPNPLLTDYPVRPPAGEVHSTKSAPGGFVPEGEGSFLLPPGEGQDEGRSYDGKLISKKLSNFIYHNLRVFYVQHMSRIFD